MKNSYFNIQQHGGMLCLLRVILMLPLCQIRAQGYWEEVAQMPTVNNLASVQTIDSSIYVVGGFFSPNQALTEVFSFSPANKALQARSPLPKALGATATAVLNGKIYLFGGVSSSLGAASKSSYAYDPSTDQWASLADMPIARGYAVAEAINGKIYLIGGFGTGAAPVYNLTEAYDPQTNTWETRAPMMTARGYMCSAVLDNRIYVLGGGLPSTNTSLDAVEIYDPASDSWALGSSLPTPRLGAAAGVLGKTIFVAGGAYTVQIPPDLDVTDGYAQETDWQPFAKLPFAMHGHAITEFEDNLYSFGGSSNGMGVNAILRYHAVDVETGSPLNDNGLTAFPNPTGERIILQFEKLATGQFAFFATNGALLFAQTLDGKQQHEFSVAGLPAGVYCWKWADADGSPTLSGKIMVTR